MNLAFKSSASSMLTFSLTVLGAPSTNSLASFNPNPVASLTTLITLIFWSPADAKTTLNDVFSSAAAPAAPAAGAAAATADTPNSSSIALTNYDNSTTVIFLISSIISSLFIFKSSYFL